MYLFLSWKQIWMHGNIFFKNQPNKSRLLVLSFVSECTCVSNLLATLKGLLNPRLKLTDNYIITTFEWPATVPRSLINAKESASVLLIYLFNYWSVTIKKSGGCGSAPSGPILFLFVYWCFYCCVSFDDLLIRRFDTNYFVLGYSGFGGLFLLEEVSGVHTTKYVFDSIHFLNIFLANMMV